MSQFLAPIHTWLFNKIVVLENIEKKLVASVDNNTSKEAHDILVNKFGDFIPNQPLKTMIDESNIHGWLQEKITIAETRQAAFVNKLIEVNDNAMEGISTVYYQTGVETAIAMESKLEDPADLYQALNNVLLEGMPCDRVNSVIEQNNDMITWKTSTCVHKNNWESQGVNVDYFYDFRAAFTKGFIETLSTKFGYNYSNDGVQLHEIAIK